MGDKTPPNIVIPTTKRLANNDVAYKLEGGGEGSFKFAQKFTKE